MKQFLVLLAVLPIMLIVMVEFSLNAMVNAKIDAVNDIVYTYKEQAKQDGTFAKVIDDMKTDIQKIIGTDEEIRTTGTYIDETPKYRVTSMRSTSPNTEDYFIHYHLEIPISEMKSMGGLIKIKNQKHYYVIDSYTASERLPSEDQ
ncbi:MAG: hypothetical protein Q4E99_02660 [Bacillota bacterium]|nr:hypothetical protein [Bacillota bacterium]